MASLSNRGYVGRGLELMAEGLEPFIEQHMSQAAPAGKDWLELVSAREAAKHGRVMEVSKSDPQLQLKVLTGHREVFLDLIGHSGIRFASEIWDYRKAWAHNDKFSSRETGRALETILLLLEKVGAAGPAAEVQKLLDGHRRDTMENQARDKARKANSSATFAVDGYGLKSWREVMTPHQDVLDGQFRAAEFAADLHQVAIVGSDNDEYAKPVDFFRRTYLTAGLRELLGNSARRLAGDTNADPVFNLQTNFGGGKTHSMLAVWHLCAPDMTIEDFPQSVQDLLNEQQVELPAQVRRVALVGNRFDSAQPTKHDDVEVNTLWGELAWQLGGREAYEMVRASDEARTPPGHSLQELLERYAPCVILIDEWVAYARLLLGRDDLPGGTFEGQFSFAQTLTEVAKAVPGVMVLVSIPASHDPASDRRGHADEMEVGGIRGQEALERLQQVVGRVARNWRPATSDESFEIVRRRLFQEPSAQARRDRDVIAKSLMRFYREHSAEFPREVLDSAYEDEIKRAYPIHPELFKRLYEDWSTLERFQRTRGVLRLMSTVVHRLWTGDSAPIIMPGSLPLSDELVQGEITHYLSDTWKAVIDADVDGGGSTPHEIDKSRSIFSQRHLTARLARAAFLGSAATIGSSRKGIERSRIWLGTALPGDVVGNFGSALHLLSEQAMYFYEDGSRYWYDTQASVNRMARDRAEEYRGLEDELYAEIGRRLSEREQKAKTVFQRRVYPAPTGSGDIPDRPEVGLVLIHPRYPYSSSNGQDKATAFVTQALESSGSSSRVNQNMLVFAAPDREQLKYLLDAVSHYLAWKSITEQKNLQVLPDQVEMARNRRKSADDTVWLRLTQTYSTVLYPVWGDEGRISLRSHSLDESGETIAERVENKLKNQDQLRVVMAARLVRHDLENKLSKVWERGHISMGELWGYYCRFPYLPRLRNRGVLEAAVLGVLDDSFTGGIEGFALAHSYDEASERFVELVLPETGEGFSQLTDNTLLVELGRAKAQRERELQEQAEESSESITEGEGIALLGGSGGDTSIEPSGETVEETSRKVANVRFWATHQVDSERFSRDLNSLGRNLLALLAAPEGVELDVRVEINARKAEGFPEDTVMKVNENLSHLKVEGHFEDE